jgi:hypothetical protein
VQRSITTNTLFYGDNLTIMREYIPEESVDLVYLETHTLWTSKLIPFSCSTILVRRA